MTETNAQIAQSSLSEFRPQRLLILLLVLSFGIIIIRLAALAFFQVPTRSMEPTIEAGDYLVVNKIPMQWYRVMRLVAPETGSPQLKSHVFQNGSIVAFWLPVLEPHTAARQEVYVKRIAACAGDTFCFSGGRLVVADAARNCTPDSLQPGYLVHQDHRVPYRSQRIDLRAENVEGWRRIIEGEGNQLVVDKGIVYINGNAAPEYLLQHDYYIMLGDNSSDSYDSRFFGYVIDDAVIGYASMVYWSTELDSAQNHTRTRWSRIAHCLH